MDIRLTLRAVAAAAAFIVALDAKTGCTIWQFFPAAGLRSATMMQVLSGDARFVGRPGNVLLAFAVESTAR